jgi:hypothetical protein
MLSTGPGNSSTSSGLESLARPGPFQRYYLKEINIIRSSCLQNQMRAGSVQKGKTKQSAHASQNETIKAKIRVKPCGKERGENEKKKKFTNRNGKHALAEASDIS